MRRAAAGGLQLRSSTWRARGSGDFAERVDLANRNEQIAVAEVDPP